MSVVRHGEPPSTPTRVNLSAPAAANLGVPTGCATARWEEGRCRDRGSSFYRLTYRENRTTRPAIPGFSFPPIIVRWDEPVHPSGASTPAVRRCRRCTRRTSGSPERPARSTGPATGPGGPRWTGRQWPSPPEPISVNANATTASPAFSKPFLRPHWSARYERSEVDTGADVRGLSPRDRRRAWVGRHRPAHAHPYPSQRRRHRNHGGLPDRHGPGEPDHQSARPPADRGLLDRRPPHRRHRRRSQQGVTVQDPSSPPGNTTHGCPGSTARAGPPSSATPRRRPHTPRDRHPRRRTYLGD
jgi:hypothetical protein